MLDNSDEFQDFMGDGSAKYAGVWLGLQGRAVQAPEGLTDDRHRDGGACRYEILAN